MVPVKILLQGISALYAATGVSTWLLQNVVNPLRGVKVDRDGVTVNVATYCFALTNEEAARVSQDPKVGGILRSAQKRHEYFERARNA